MALPKLKTLTYELELPSTGETVKYRPFLVKEQKHLMIAQESEDTKLIENAFANIISDCTFGEIDPYKMPLFDVEYVFLRLRGKSVGEKIKINRCKIMMERPRRQIRKKHWKLHQKINYIF